VELPVTAIKRVWSGRAAVASRPFRNAEVDVGVVVVDNVAHALTRGRREAMRRRSVHGTVPPEV
jgi:hypothetical protein